MVKLEELIKTKEFWINRIQNRLYGIIEEQMEEKGWTQTQLADKLGVGRSYVSQVLNGNFNHRLDKLITLSLAVEKVPDIDFKGFDEFLEKEKGKKPSSTLIVMENGISDTSWENDNEEGERYGVELRA